MKKKLNLKKCRIYALSYIFAILTFSITFFVRNEIYFRNISINDDTKTNIVFNSDSVKVIDSYKLTRKERYETAIYIDSYWRKEGKHFRSIESIEAEIYAHRIAYLLGVNKIRSKDADIDLKEDKRLYVKASYIALMVFGG